jgi:hypothetical protein
MMTRSLSTPQRSGVAAAARNLLLVHHGHVVGEHGEHGELLLLVVLIDDVGLTFPLLG